MPCPACRCTDSAEKELTEWRQDDAKAASIIACTLRANLHFTLWMCIANDSSKVKKHNQKKSNGMPVMEIEGKLTTHRQTIAEKFNTYYISVADITKSNQTKNTIDNSNKKDPLSHLYSAFQQSFTSIKLKNTTIGEIENIITELKHKNSCGYDKVTTKILKTVSPFIVSPLTHICNRMLSTGTFPDRLKYSEMKPIYKKGNKTQITGQFVYSLYFLRSLKKFYIRDYTITYLQTTY